MVKGKQPYIVHTAHTVKLGEILEHFKIIKPNFKKHNQNRQSKQIQKLSSQFMSISIPLKVFVQIHTNLTFGCCLAPFALPKQASAIKFQSPAYCASHSLLSSYEQFWQVSCQNNQKLLNTKSSITQQILMSSKLKFSQEVSCIFSQLMLQIQSCAIYCSKFIANFHFLPKMYTERMAISQQIIIVVT